MNMSVELNILVWVVVLGFVQLVSSSSASMMQRGFAWAAGARDNPGKTLVGAGGRLERAYKNFLETLPFFIAGVVVNQFAGTHGSSLSVNGAWIYFVTRVLYVPAYVVNVPYLRSVVWFAAMAGLVMMLVAPF